MAYSSDSSSEDELQDAISQVLAEDDISWAAWLGTRSPEVEEEKDESLGRTDSTKDSAVRLASRAYQLEMLDASLKENVIVAMDTGTGKTQVAILRIEAELGKMALDQIIWFLTPNVSLCAQQFDVVNAQIPHVQSKLITGAQNVDSWKAVTWDAALANVKVVVATPQVLLDALLHGFVKISSLALIIFDEAHHCGSNHPYSRIMKEFYWVAKPRKEPVPHVLGLTASPVIGSDFTALEKLETILDSVCRSPTKHRDELVAISQRPSLVSIAFKPKLQLASSEYSESIRKLVAARNKLNIMEDPWILSLLNDGSDRARRQLEKALKRRSTYVQDSMKQFCRRSIEMAAKIGSWAADWYIFETIRRFLAGVMRQGATSESWRDSEVVYLVRVFQDADIQEPPSLYEQSELSDKVQRLIEVLVGKGKDTKGIVFVQERATTAVLAHILAIHPEVSKTFQTGVMIGTSLVPGVKHDFLDLPQAGAQLALEQFRAGKKNLLVATSVLEEGIDVPACNLIVCVDKPVNLKSFIQRRGRARMRESLLYIFVDEQDSGAPTNWEELEAGMKRHYEEEMRELQKIEALEDMDELDYPELHVESTGAHLTLIDAKSHLSHFCTTLSSRKYVDHQPDYIIEELHDSARSGAPILLKATVLLPISVPQNVRQATSSRSWLSEKNACMDAAFQAYEGLHRAGLLDDHLLPLRQSLESGIESRPGMMTVRALTNPWLEIARDWVGDQVQLYQRTLSVLDQTGSVVCQFELVLPRAIPEMKPVAVWWNYETQWTMRLDPEIKATNGEPSISSNGASGVGGHTHVLLSLAYCHRKMVIRDDCVLRIISRSDSLSTDRVGNTPFTPELAVVNGGQEYLVRDERQGADRHPYFFDSYLPSKPPIETIQKAYKGFEDESADSPFLAVRRWPRKSGFFHRPGPPELPPTAKKYSRVIPAETATIDTIPRKYAQFGLLIPALMHYMELYLLATELSQTLLQRLKLSDVSQVVDAICATGARTPTDYERVEFLGDSILKTCVTVNVAATNLRLPEGLLSILKDRLVSNERLRRAARDSGLDQYIVTQQLVLKGWRPPYVGDLLDEDRHDVQDERILATKTLADVVEALIGVSFLDGGLSKALGCISLFLPESQVKGFQAVRDTLFDAAEPKNMLLPSDLAPLEALLEHTFNEKALLVEAVTHPSYNVVGTVACFDRLEFIGDAILDFIVVEELFAVKPPLANSKMHLLRTALVNADILGFFVMEYSYKQSRFDVASPAEYAEENEAYISSRGGTRNLPTPELIETEVDIPLWSFMRQASPELTIEREATKVRYAALREPVLTALRTGTHYPWALLARLKPQKFYSDFFEALVGAVWVDSGPDFEASRRFVERAGILPYVRRLLRDHVHALHPKEELGRLANSDKVDYVMTEVVGEGDEGTTWACEVKIGGRRVVAVDGCLFKEEAKVTAATRACAALKAIRC